MKKLKKFFAKIKIKKRFIKYFLIFISVILTVFITYSLFSLKNIFKSYNISQLENVILEKSKIANYNKGFFLYSPILTNETFLYSYDKKIINSWESDNLAIGGETLLENGDLIRVGQALNDEFKEIWKGGAIEVFDWKGNLKGKCILSDSNSFQHHSAKYLKNGNILLSIAEKVSKEELIKKGKNPKNMDRDYILSEKIIELNYSNCEIVWEWKIIDHLVQNFDKTKENYGNPKEFNNKININNISKSDNKLINNNKYNELAHFNNLDFNDETKEILITSSFFDEIWIIDYKDENFGIKYRFGSNFFGGEQILYFPHDARWTKDGNITIFNDGYGEKKLSEIILVKKENKNLKLIKKYQLSHFSTFMSSAELLDNGNYFVADGPSGKMYELNIRNGNIEFEFNNQIKSIYFPTPSVFKANYYSEEFIKNILNKYE